MEINGNKKGEGFKKLEVIFKMIEFNITISISEFEKYFTSTFNDYLRNNAALIELKTKGSKLKILNCRTITNITL